jgi:hypothetical protein
MAKVQALLRRAIEGLERMRELEAVLCATPEKKS